jgi:hypothetical protein
MKIKLIAHIMLFFFFAWAFNAKSASVEYSIFVDSYDPYTPESSNSYATYEFLVYDPDYVGEIGLGGFTLTLNGDTENIVSTSDGQSISNLDAIMAFPFATLQLDIPITIETHFDETNYSIGVYDENSMNQPLISLEGLGNNLDLHDQNMPVNFGASVTDITFQNIPATGLDSTVLDRSGMLTYVPPTPVPLPPALWLFCSGIFGLIGLGNKNKLTIRKKS